MLSLNSGMNYTQENGVQPFYAPDMGLFNMMLSQEIPYLMNPQYFTNCLSTYPTKPTNYPIYPIRQDMIVPPTVASDTSVSRLIPPYFSQPYRRRTSRSSSPENSNKRYMCRLCNKRFTRPSSLTTHIYSHTGEKPFKCPVSECGRQFSVVSNLRRHAKIHNSCS